LKPNVAHQHHHKMTGKAVGRKGGLKGKVIERLPGASACPMKVTLAASPVIEMGLNVFDRRNPRRGRRWVSVSSAAGRGYNTRAIVDHDWLTRKHVVPERITHILQQWKMIIFGKAQIGNASRPV
jgi:hypothetical protein